MKKELENRQSSALFEGMTSLRAVLYAMENGIGDRRIVSLKFDRSKQEKKRGELSFIRKMSEIHGFSVELADPSDIDSISLGTSHGGVIFECTDRTIPALSAEEIVPGGFYVMIEGIEDPYNFGYALRSLYAAGIDGAVLTPRNWMSAAGVVCRSSAGASERIPLYISDAEEAVGLFRSRGYKTVCAGIRDSVSSFDADLKKPIFLIVGGERRGISSKVLKLADETVRLDYGRDFPGSLSAASAASILGYEVLRQNRQSPEGELK